MQVNKVHITSHSKGQITVGFCSFAFIIGAPAITVFQPFGDKWEKKKIKQAMDRYEEEGEL